MTIIYLSKVLYNMGYSAFEIGVLYAIIPIVRFLSPFVFSRYELNRKVFLASLVIFLASAASFFFTIHSFYLLSMSFAFFGLAVSIVLPYIESIALAVLQKEKYGKVRLYGSIGFALVALVLPYYMENYNATLLFLFVSVVLLVAAAYYVSLAKLGAEIEMEDPTSGFSFGKELGLWLSIFFMQLSFGAFYSFFTIYETESGFSVNTVSYFWIFGVLCEIVMFYFQGSILKRFSLYSLIRFTVLATAFRWLLLFLYADNLVVVLLSQSFHALSFALYHTAVVSYLFANYEKKKLAQQFYYGLAYGLGMFLGSLIAGVTYGPYLFLFSAAMAFIAFASLYIKPNTFVKK